MMKQQSLVTEQFGNTANAYATSAVHSQGEDLKSLRRIAEGLVKPRILDLGCGAGHASFAVAPAAASVTAYDLSEQMLAVVAQGAKERTLDNVQTNKGAAEKLPFPDGAFDLVISRFSVHHWLDVPGALSEVHRVLTEKGRAVFVDVVSPESPLNDTTLQAVELLRDASHVRDYRVSEWGTMLAAAHFTHACTSNWRLIMVFDDWVARMRTPADRVKAIKSLFDSAPEEARRHFEVQSDYSFSIDVALFEARKESRD
jgi:ubiquinone/menaquinone biosynthesis C-methylase UbiE